MAAKEITLKAVNAIGEVPADAWDACANPSALNGLQRGLKIRLITHSFHMIFCRLSSCRARSATAPAGSPCTSSRKAGSAVVGVVPCYAKSHSQGEYVFDHGWAEAYERAGGDYYPKLQVAVPFTPAQGRRLLVRPGEHADAVRDALADSLADICKRSNASSVHVTFLTEDEWRMLGSRNYLQRTHRQFHWINEGYDSFDAFLAALSSRKRKTIRREREDALSNGITIDWLTGSDLTESVWDTFFEFYMDTGSRKWGRPYLTRSFYSIVGEKMRDQILLVMAKRNGRYIAGAINFIGSDTLFGRHWGCLEQHAFLHFEVCYYQAMQFAIERNWPRRGRRRRLAQGHPRLYADHDLFGTLHRRSAAAPRDRRFPQPRARQCRRQIEEYAEAAPFRKDVVRKSRTD